MCSADKPNSPSAQWSSPEGLSARIQNKHGVELTKLRAALIASRGEGLQQPGRRQHRIGPLTSFENPNINLTIVAETVEFGWFTVGPAPTGTCLTVSIAAHQKAAGIQTSVPPAECDAWMQALLGGAWRTHAYRCECATGVAARNVVSYRLFLDATNRPAPKPPEVRADACRPLLAAG